MKTLALAAVLAAIIAAMFTVSSAEVTAAVPALELVLPSTIEDECMCGGEGWVIGKCEHVDYIGWVQLYWNGRYMSWTWCTP